MSPRAEATGAGADAPASWSERVQAAAEEIGRFMCIDFTQNPFAAFDRKVFIASASRTGSNWLCESLRRRGLPVGGGFTPAVVRRNADGEDSLARYCQHKLDVAARRGAFGAKGPPESMAPMFLAGEFPVAIHQWRFVFLRRCNLVRQAISSLIAQRSGTWRSVQAGRELAEETYDGAAIAELVRRFDETNAAWRAFFAEHSVQPFLVTYEDLCAEEARVIGEVVRFVGAPRSEPLAAAPARLAPQSTALNNVWEARFRAEHIQLLERMETEA